MLARDDKGKCSLRTTHYVLLLYRVRQTREVEVPNLDRRYDDRSAGRALREQIRARRQGVAERGPELVQPLGLTTYGEALLASARDDRPETACAADGCFRPTRDGICDRCREQAAAEDVQAANAELIERLRANQRERAHTRPEPDPTAEPRYFTRADYDPARVHAAQKRAATDRSTT